MSILLLIGLGASCVMGQTPAPETPEPVRTSITVVEKLETASPAAVTLVPRLELQRNPGVNLDDRLRQVPGFSLLRRSSSMVANPTTQGVSLRGVGPTGASRTLVLWDGIPLNSPFGGWVYWTRVAPDELERVEVTRSASTSVFGDRAMGGSIALFSRAATSHRVHGSYEGGNRASHQLSGGLALLERWWAASANVRGFQTDGYFIVPEEYRGQVDRKANVRFAAGDTRLDFFSGRNRLFVKLDMLAEERGNGTQLQRNSSSLGTIAGHYGRDFSKDMLSAFGFHSREEFRAAFTTVAADRNSERISQIQSVPAESYGSAAYWQHRGSGWELLGGGDFLKTKGYSRETLPTGFVRRSGGELTQGGAFGQVNARLGWLSLFAGARQQLASRDRNFFAPSAGVSAGKGVARFRGSVYRAFRYPTLNELHRQFRVGNVVTLANEELRPETVFGAEAGVDLIGERSSARFTIFRSSLDELITNVTLRVTPSLIERQRQNAAGALSRGVEAELRHRWKALSGSLSYLFVDSRFETGERIPQVPRHQGAAEIAFSKGRTLLGATLRSYAYQFEDDRNQFLLPGYASIQASLRQGLGAGFSAVVVFENLLDKVYYVGFTPTPTVGSPRLWRAGLRWDSGVR